MQLHVVPPGDMTEGSLAGLRDEPLLHFFVPFSVIVRKRKNEGNDFLLVDVLQLLRRFKLP